MSVVPPMIMSVIMLCPYNSVLETAFIKHRRYKNNYTDAKEMTLKYAVVN